MNDAQKTAVEVKNLNFSYAGIPALEDINFKVTSNTLCAIVGPNGAGKSTLIKCIVGLMKPSSGEVNVHCSHNSKSHSIGYVPQRHTIEDNFPISVLEVVSTGRIIGNRKWFRFNKEDKEKIDHAIESVGLQDLGKQKFHELSGGQQQRVLIAKALTSEPDVLILDEPTAGVDAQSQQLFRDALAHTIKDHQTTVLLVSHELSAVSELVEQILVLKKKILFDGTPQELTDKGVSLGIHEHDLPIWLERITAETMNVSEK